MPLLGTATKKITLELQTGHLQTHKLVPSFYFTTKHAAAEIILDLLKQGWGFSEHPPKL